MMYSILHSAFLLFESSKNPQINKTLILEYNKQIIVIAQMNKKEIFDNLNPPKVGTNSVAANGFRGSIPSGYIKMNTLKNPFRCEAGNSDFHCEAGSKLPDDIVNNLPDDYYPSEFQDNGE